MKLESVAVDSVPRPTSDPSWLVLTLRPDSQRIPSADFHNVRLVISDNSVLHIALQPIAVHGCGVRNLTQRSKLTGLVYPSSRQPIAIIENG
jgi:hypothetical protein